MEKAEPFLCNEPLKPELATVVWENIGQETTIERDVITRRFARDGKTEDIDKALRLLYILDLVRASGKGLTQAEIPSDILRICQQSSQEGFRLLVLDRLRQLGGDSPDFGQQAHFLLTYQILCEDQDSGVLDTDDQTLIDLIGRGWKGKGYHPVGKSGTVELNPRKFAYWKELALYLGIAYPGPRLKLFIPAVSTGTARAFVSLFIMNSEEFRGRREAPLDSFLEFVKSRLLSFDVMRTSMYPALSSVIQGLLITLKISGALDFSNQGDSPVYEIKNMRGQTRQVNTIVAANIAEVD